MPEVLGEGGVYFNPEDPATIAAAVERLITDPALRVEVARTANARAQQFSWARCASETWSFLRANVPA
jgi:glycosyltransferase involved in cell wall biosynthesis